MYVIQICSGITCGIVLKGELYTQRLQKFPLSGEKSSYNSLYTNANKLTLAISVCEGVCVCECVRACVRVFHARYEC